MLRLGIILVVGVIVAAGATPTFRYEVWNRWLFSFPGPDRTQIPLATVDNCEVPGIADSPHYARLEEEQLPWHLDPPPALLVARQQQGAAQLVVAFRTTLTDTIYEEAHNVARGAALLSGVVVAPGKVFSLNEQLAPYTRERGYRDGPTYVRGRIVPTIGGGVCKIASAVYNLAILGDLRVVERHPHSLPVPYVPPGRDATVAYGYKDLKITNTSAHPVVFWATMEGLSLYVALYGSYTAPEVYWHHEELARRPHSVIRRPVDGLVPGQERIALRGYDGVTVHTWIIVRYDGGRLERRELGVDHYRPIPEVIEYGP